jgi:hypothetical protein
MDPLEREAPPAGEQVHMPGPSLMPLLLAVGITFALVGITTYIEFTVAGGILAIWVLVRWIGAARAELDELPPEH